MDTIDTVSARLDAALTRLETAIDTLIARQRVASDENGGDSALAAQVAELGAECDTLRTALDSTQRQYEDLRSVSQAASTRLGETIGHVRVLLEDDHGPSHGSH